MSFTNMFGEEIFQFEDITARVRHDASIELSHINAHGYRNSKVYYGYDIDQALKAYTEENEL